METQKVELARCARYFVTYVRVCAYLATFVVAIGIAGTIFGAVANGWSAVLVGTLFTLMISASAYFQFWMARVTTQGRPVGVQVALTLQLVGGAIGIIRLFAQPDLIVVHFIALILQALFIWWFYRVMVSLTAKTPAAPSMPTQAEWIL